jgi:hypothetical protein
MEGKKSFVLYTDQREVFEELDDELAGKLIKHIFAYVNDENPETDDLLINAVFANIKATLKRDLNYPINQYQLFDLQGQLLLEKNVAPKITETTIIMEHLPQGIYLLKLWSKNEFITYFKVIKN